MPPDVATTEQRARRRTLSRVWFGVVIAYSLIRAVVVWQALGDYGVNVWIYLVIDMTCAVIDGINTAKLVISIADERYRDARKEGLIALVTFIVPDLYIVYAGNKMPKMVYFVLGGIVVLAFLAGVIHLKKKVSKILAEREIERATLP